MNTSKSISSIHYIEPLKLKVKLDDLIAKNHISFYAFIKHLKEEDETKDHIHLYIIPNGKINTDELRNELEFLDMNNPTKPIRSLPFTNSKFQDWYLYALHDKAYLLSKAQGRKYHYKNEEIFVSDPDYFNELIHQVDFSKFKTQSLVIQQAEQQVPFDVLVSSGQIPVQQIMQYQRLYEIVYNSALKRQRYTHDNVQDEEQDKVQDELQYDDETGEIVDQQSEQERTDSEVPW